MIVNYKNVNHWKTWIMLISFSCAATMTQAQTLSQNKQVGSGIYEIVFNKQENAVYVASAGSRTAPAGKIYKLHAETLAILDSIDVKSAPAYGLGLNQKTQTLYTSNTRDNSVHAIDLKTGKIVATVNSGAESSHTRELVVDETKNLVYVSNVQKEGEVWVIDGKTNQFSHSIKTGGGSPTGLAIDGKRNALYVINMADSAVATIDLSTNKVIRTFMSGGSAPINLVYDAKGDRLFVTHQGSNNVTVLQAETGKVLHTVDAGKGAIGVSFDAVRGRLYVANRGDGNVSIINTENYQTVATIATGTLPNSVVVNPKNGFAYVTNKARGARRVEGQPTPPADTNGDTVSLIKP